MMGSVERFMGILIEHFGGAFPVWLAPAQAVVLPVSDRFLDYGAEVTKKLQDAGARVELDRRSEKLGYKIRDAQARKVPYMLVIGGREQEAGTVSLRLREAPDGGSADQGRGRGGRTRRPDRRAHEYEVARFVKLRLGG